MKRLIKGLGILAAVLLLAGNVMASPTTLYDITGISGTDVYKDTKSELVKLTDTDGKLDDATAFLMFEYAGFRDENVFGIYDKNGKQLDLFNGSNNPIFGEPPTEFNSVTVTFNLTTKKAKIGAGAWQDFDATQAFGFYIKTPENGGQQYYSQTSKNADGYDHMMLFDTSDNQVGALLGSNVVVAIEDLWGGGDNDFNDMVVGMTDVKPVPEPATLLLLGSGLIGLANAGRKKMRKTA